MKKGGTDGGRESRRKGRREGRKGGSDRRGLRGREGARGREGVGGGEKDGKEDQEEKSNKEELSSTVPCFRVASSRGDRPWRGLAWMAVFLCEHGPYRDYDAHCTVRVVTRYVCCVISGHCPN